MQRNIGYFDYLDLFKLFNTMVKLVLLYGAETWVFKHLTLLKMFKINFVEDILSYLLVHLIFLPEGIVTYILYLLTIIANVSNIGFD